MQGPVLCQAGSFTPCGGHVRMRRAGPCWDLVAGALVLQPLPSPPQHIWLPALPLALFRHTIWMYFLPVLSLDFLICKIVLCCLPLCRFVEEVQ